MQLDFTLESDSGSRPLRASVDQLVIAEGSTDAVWDQENINWLYNGGEGRNLDEILTSAE